MGDSEVIQFLLAGSGAESSARSQQVPVLNNGRVRPGRRRGRP
jgi:hypothetical protein